MDQVLKCGVTTVGQANTPLSQSFCAALAECLQHAGLRITPAASAAGNVEGVRTRPDRTRPANTRVDLSAGVYRGGKMIIGKPMSVEIDVMDANFGAEAAGLSCAPILPLLKRTD